MMLLISSQYPSPIHPVLHPLVVDWPPVEVYPVVVEAVVIGGVVGWLVGLVKPPVVVVDPEMVVVL